MVEPIRDYWLIALAVVVLVGAVIVWLRSRR
jgi:hypothetical protein